MHDQDLEPGTLGSDLLGHGRVVEPPEDGGHHEERRRALIGDEGHLAPSIDGDERVLPGAEASERADEDKRLVPGRQLPADRRVPPDAVLGVEAGGRTQAGVAETAEGELRPGVLVCEHGLGGRSRSPLDEFPDGRRADPASGCGAPREVFDEVGHRPAFDHS